jgi:hypothetical protein
MGVALQGGPKGCEFATSLCVHPGTDRSLWTARPQISSHKLTRKGYSGQEVSYRNTGDLSKTSMTCADWSAESISVPAPRQGWTWPVWVEVSVGTSRMEE